MNRSKFQQLKQYLGADLLNYALNRSDIVYGSNFETFSFTDAQISALEDLDSVIRSSRIRYITEGGYGDGAHFYLQQLSSNGESIFNHYRTACGAAPVHPTSDDPLIAYLQDLCIRNYPNLLMKSSDERPLLGMTAIGVGLDQYNEFIALVKMDVLDRITNGKNGLDYAFEFTTEDDLKLNIQVCTACTTLIYRAFYDACNRMDYSLHAVLETITRYVGDLRNLAIGNSIEYSSFVGLRGARYSGFVELALDGATMRQYGGVENPGLHTQRTIVRHSDGLGEYSGHVLEIIHQTKLRSLEAAHSITTSEIAHRHQQSILEKVLFALIFSCEYTRGPAASFFETSFPLAAPGNYSCGGGGLAGSVIIDSSKIEHIRSWFNTLRDKPLEKVRVPLGRLKYAVFERRSPEDAVIDAVISWEGMFGGAPETTLRVTGSLAKYLWPLGERADALKRLKQLYKFRSELVHGANGGARPQVSDNNIRDEAVDIGLRCLKKLLEDETLLPMSPTERANYLLVLGAPE